MASTPLWLCCCSLLARSAAGSTMSSASGDVRSGGELHLGGDRRRAVLVDPAGEVRPDPVAQHSRGAMMRREASSFSSSSAIVENVSFDAFLQEESSSGEGCEGEETVNQAEGGRKYSSVWGNDGLGLGHARSMLDSPQAWSSKDNAANQWMQIDLGSVKRIGGVITQGRANSDQRVVRFEVLISKDGGDFEDLGGVMGGNGDSNTKVENRVTPKYGQYVRFLVKEWFNHISMRAAVLTCKETTTTTTSTTSTTTTKKKVLKAGASSRGASGAGAVLAAVMAWWVTEQP